MMNHEDLPLFWVNRLSFLSRKEIQKRFSDAGELIAAEEWATLLMLWQQDGIAPSQIAEATTRDRTTTTRLLDRMQKKNLVTRKAGQPDGRSIAVCLTEHGHAIKGLLVPIALSLVADATEEIEKGDLDITIKTLKAMSNRILRMKD